MRKLQNFLLKFLLTLVGFGIIFNIRIAVRVFYAHTALGLEDTWQRPLYYLVVKYAPWIIDNSFWQRFISTEYWLQLVLSLGLPILAIIAFERIREKSLTLSILFYLFIPPGLCYLVLEIFQHFYPYL